MRPPPRKALPLAEEERDGRREADPVDRIGVEQPTEEDDELVAGAGPVGGDAPVVGKPLAVEEAEHGLRVADVDGEEHDRERIVTRCLACVPDLRRTQALSLEGVVLVEALRFADPLGERLGGEARLVSLAAELLDGHVARRCRPPRAG